MLAPKHPDHGFHGTILAKRGAAAAKKAWEKAFAEIELAVSAATGEEIRTYLDSDYGHHVAVEVLGGKSVAEQIELRGARFRRTFETVCRQLELKL